MYLLRDTDEHIREMLRLFLLLEWKSRFAKVKTGTKIIPMVGLINFSETFENNGKFQKRILGKF